ncbi:TLC domain-containing protein [Panaeolus papilionaceus]|nr:TLC domain-containing protein [Panaeolus papilionaceus]
MGKKQRGSFLVSQNHHITSAFETQTPISSTTPTRSSSPLTNRTFEARRAERSLFVRWIIEPSISIKLLLLPIVLYVSWELLAPYVETESDNPFTPIFLLSGHAPSSTPEDPRYQKSWYDLLFLAYYVVLFSFVRQVVIVSISRPLARWFGLKREAKIERFGEQVYAVVYFAFFGAWGYRVMGQIFSSWYNTNEFWLGYPRWDMKPELKRYYLMQFAYWWHQLLVLVLGLEKPRKDYTELVIHHFVTLWLVGWSYMLNLTYIGNAVFMSMDIPDALFAFSKILNYIQWNTVKIYSFLVFFCSWTYFRHYLNLHILWSVWYEQPNVPEWTKRWSWSEGVYMPTWMRYQIFVPLLLLQFLNLFWYRLILRILVRAITTAEADDDRSDDEGDGELELTKED